MSKLFSVLVALIGFSFAAVDADARRMSGGKNMGTQRQSVSPSQTAPKAPAQQQQAAPAQQQAAAKAAPTAPPAQQPSGMSKWLGPLAGLAIGAGLAALFFNNGMGGALMGILLLAALVMGAVFLFRMFRGARPAQEPLRYAGAGAPYGGREPAVPAPAPMGAPMGYGAAPHSVAATTQAAAPAVATQWPADFDAESFLRHARMNFVNLQAAHDRKDLSTIRDFMTPELYRDIEADVRALGDAPQKTDIVTLNAEVIDVVTENDLYVVSVRFSGLIREAAGAEAQPFNEVWHLEKPVNGRSGWLVSGIQQA
jgi:predicted lipid-binding transport protein (Tim44 family)